LAARAAIGTICAAVLFSAPYTSQAADWQKNGNGQCGDPATLIHDIQGAGLSSPMVGATVTIEGVVVGDYQTDLMNGFFVQDEDAESDADPATSEGIFVFEGALMVSVAVGDLVRVAGTVAEYVGQTELTSVTGIVNCGATSPVTPAAVTLPFSTTTFPERYEGMAVVLPQDLVVTELYNLDRAGVLTLSFGARLVEPTEVVSPGAPAIALQAANDLNRIELDDGSLAQNPDPIIHPAPELLAGNTIRGGDIVRNIVGVLAESNPGWVAAGVAYRVHPTATPTYVHTNPRPIAAPAVGGNLRVASFSLLNFFNGDGLGGGFPTARGANNLTEFQRQRDKLVAALALLDADVVGLTELENDGFGPQSAIADLVAAVNAVVGAGTYAFVDPGTAGVGVDVIAVGLIYKPAKATAIGAAAILDTPASLFTGEGASRAILAQTFAEASSGERFTVAVNHFKSKGGTPSVCAGNPADPDCDQGDGQLQWNAQRTATAAALAAWLATDPTGSGDPDFLLLGDFNAFAKEDPIRTLETAGYSKLPASGYTYVFDGQWGTFDYALASASLLSQTSGAANFHINADEPKALDYNTEFRSAAQQTKLYAPTAYRASDHDPVVVGLALGQAPLTCGDGKLDAGEQCDPPFDSACPGRCEATCQCPMLVVLASFEARRVVEGVRVSWTTAIEIDTVGFRVLREIEGSALGLQAVTPQMIPSRGSDLQGAEYSVLDPAKASGAVRYWLEDTDVYGKVTLHGPVEPAPLAERREAAPTSDDPGRREGRRQRQR